jgi:hypothetical protein
MSRKAVVLRDVPLLLAMVAAWSAGARAGDRGRTVDPADLKQYDPHMRLRIKEPPPPARSREATEPSREYEVAKLDELTLTGVHVVLKSNKHLERLMPGFRVAEAVIVAEDAVDAAFAAHGEAARDRMIVISSEQRVLRYLKEHGRLRRGDPAYDAIVADLRSEVAKGPYPSGLTFFERAITSKEGLLAAGEVSLRYYVPTLLGEWAAEKLRAGPRLSALGLSELAASRDVPRAVWRRADQVARVLSKVVDGVVEEGAKSAIRPPLEAGLHAAAARAAAPARPDAYAPPAPIAVPDATAAAARPAEPDAYAAPARSTTVAPAAPSRPPPPPLRPNASAQVQRDFARGIADTNRQIEGSGAETRAIIRKVNKKSSFDGNNKSLTE